MNVGGGGGDAAYMRSSRQHLLFFARVREREMEDDSIEVEKMNKRIAESSNIECDGCPNFCPLCSTRLFYTERFGTAPYNRVLQKRLHTRFFPKCILKLRNHDQWKKG